MFTSKRVRHRVVEIIGSGRWFAYFVRLKRGGKNKENNLEILGSSLFP